MTIRAQYHVPRSQVWAGSRGNASGRVHLHVDGKVLCRPASRPWYPRDPMPGEQRCTRCAARAEKLHIEWPVQP